MMEPEKHGAPESRVNKQKPQPSRTSAEMQAQRNFQSVKNEKLTKLWVRIKHNLSRHAHSHSCRINKVRSYQRQYGQLQYD